jgi:hypothetical protein
LHHIRCSVLLFDNTITNFPNYLFLVNLKGGTTYNYIAQITAIVPLIKWYYKACKTYKIRYNNSTDFPRCSCTVSQSMPM